MYQVVDILIYSFDICWFEILTKWIALSASKVRVEETKKKRERRGEEHRHDVKCFVSTLLNWSLGSCSYFFFFMLDRMSNVNIHWIYMYFYHEMYQREKKRTIILTINYWIIKISFYDLHLFDINKIFAPLTLVVT